MILRCSECGLPWLRIENGAVIVTSNHHGEHHTNVIAVAAIMSMALTDAENGCSIVATGTSEPVRIELAEE